MAINDLGMVRPGSTILIPFHAFDSNDPSASVIISDFVLADIGIYKGMSMTERASTTGVVLLNTDGINIDGATGIHGFTIDLSSNATADFYTSGSFFYVTVGPITIDGATINFVAATFSIGYPGAILDTTIATLASQVSFTISAGPADDDALNGCLCIVHDIASAVQTAQALVSDYDETTGTLTVTLAGDPGIFTMAAGDHVSFFPAHALAVWDRLLSGSTHNIASSAGRRIRQQQELGRYALGAIFIDTVNGTAGTTNFENGVDILPVDSIADANTIAASLNLSRFIVTPGSSITFAAAQASQSFFAEEWTLALGGQAVGGSHFNGADVSGTGTCASEAHFEHCELGTMTIGVAHFDNCDIEGTVTLSDAATYLFIDCAHSGTAVIDFGALVGSTTVHIHGYKGALTIENLGATATDVLHFDSPGGQLTLAASCVGGTVNFRGTAALVNNGSGMTINRGGDVVNDVAGVQSDTDDIQTRIPTSLVSGRMDADVGAISTSTAAADNLEASAGVIVIGAAEAGTLSTTQMTTDLTEATDEHYNGRIVIWTSGVLLGQASDITAYLGSTGRLTYTAVTEAPSAADTFVIV